MPARSAAARPAPPAMLVPAPAVPVSAADAVVMAQAGLAYLANADMVSVPAAAQAECLRGLERAGSLHTAARAGALAAFMAGRGHEDDGQGSARAWLRWQTRVTRGAAAGAVGWTRRLAAHPAVGDALARRGARRRGPGDLRLDRAASRRRRPTRTRSCWPPRAGGARPGGPGGLAGEMPAPLPAGPDVTAMMAGSRTGGCGWTCTSGAGRLQGDLTRSAPPRCGPCWSRWGRRPARKTTGRPASGTTTRWRKPAGG